MLSAELLFYTIPASSSPWQTNSSSGNNIPTLDKAHYAGNATNGANYTWCAATAGKGKNCIDATTTAENSEYSICPREWRLPTKGEYDALIAKGTTKVDNIDGDKFDGYNVGGAFFPTAGDVYGGSLRAVGSEGYYWSSTASDSNAAYYLGFGSDIVNTTNINRYFGYSVRCITP